MSKYQTLESTWEDIEQGFHERGSSSEDIAEFRSHWFAGAYDTIHVILPMLVDQNADAVQKLHQEAHEWMKKTQAEYAIQEQGDGHAKH